MHAAEGAGIHWLKKPLCGLVLTLQIFAGEADFVAHIFAAVTRTNERTRSRGSFMRTCASFFARLSREVVLRFGYNDWHALAKYEPDKYAAVYCALPD